MLEDSVNKNLFTCTGKGGTYELLGTARPELQSSIPSYFAEVGTSIGAGLSRKEAFVIHQGSVGLLTYAVPHNQHGVEHTPRVIYRDIQTGQLFHREQADFDDRMLPIAE